MPTNLLIELEYLGLTARLKRLSDTITKNIHELYRAERVDIEPSWHLVFLILKDKSKTMEEISEAFNTSLPVTFKIADKMRKKGYVDITKDNVDNRKKVLSLTKKTQKELPKFEKNLESGSAINKRYS